MPSLCANKYYLRNKIFVSFEYRKKQMEQGAGLVCWKKHLKSLLARGETAIPKQYHGQLDSKGYCAFSAFLSSRTLYIPGCPQDDPSRSLFHSIICIETEQKCTRDHIPTMGSLVLKNINLAMSLIGSPLCSTQRLQPTFIMLCLKRIDGIVVRLSIPKPENAVLCGLTCLIRKMYTLDTALALFLQKDFGIFISKSPVDLEVVEAVTHGVLEIYGDQPSPDDNALASFYLPLARGRALWQRLSEELPLLILGKEPKHVHIKTQLDSPATEWLSEMPYHLIPDALAQPKWTVHASYQARIAQMLKAIAHVCHTRDRGREEAWATAERETKRTRK